MTDHLDKGLRQGLDPDVAAVLQDWAELHDRYYALERWLVNGRSRAPVAVVNETDEVAVTSRLLVLKVLHAEDGRLHELEYKRHRLAVREAPEFAERHLTTFEHEAIAAGSGRWITFQTIAGKHLPDTEVLTVLLRRMLRITIEHEPAGTLGVTCTPEIFADACRSIVHGVLHNWAGPPYVAPTTAWTVPEFLRAHIGDQLAPGGRLFDVASRHQGDELHLLEEPGPLPSPFAVAKGEYFATGVTLHPFVGRTHGDLHTDNALVMVRPFDVRSFFLIDTALYEQQGPVARDPVHFVLYIIARAAEKETLSSAQFDALIDLLLDPEEGPRHLVPGWLSLVIRQVHDEAIAWVKPTGLETRWRQQTLLSFVGCAMLFLGRTSTPETAKLWFLRLAARAAAKFEREYPNASRRQARTVTATNRTGKDTIGWLCRHYPDLERRAGELGRAAEAEQLRTDALGGIERAEDLREFVRQMGGPQFDPRFGTPGSEGEFEPDVHHCPLHLCRRLEQRAPGGPVPLCHLSRTEPRRMLADAG
ncbi:MAG TPA: hypothetical protein VFC00_33095 [Micromonosporaceae bacterium]|nr:hypothetical protein [Micromonosporaceae bacterium]